MTASNDAPENDDPDSVTHALEGESPVSYAVVGAIADLEDVTPATVHTDLGITLYESIDPERLDALFESADGSGDLVVSFEIDARETYAVEIVGGDSVSVTRLPK